MRNPTIKDVANKAGVGIGTVSRVINNSAQVTPHTRQKVLDAIDDLGYEPNVAARQLSGGKTWSIGVMSPFFTTPSFVERVSGIQQRLNDSGYDLVLYSIQNTEQLGRRIVEIGTRNRVDGLIVLAISLCAELLHKNNPDLPAVFVVEEDIQHYPSILVDNVVGGQLATQFMIDRDHKMIGFLGDSPNQQYQHISPTEQRYLGYNNAMQRAELPIVDEWCVFAPYNQQEAMKAALHMLSQADRPTALVASNDTMAFGVLEAARRLDLRVPQDIAVIGFDDIPAAYNAGITTVKQPLFNSGHLGTEYLLNWLETGQVPPEKTVLPLEVVQRTTA